MTQPDDRTGPPAGRPRPRLRTGPGNRGRPAWWLQILLAVGFAQAYDGVRALHGNVGAVAVTHGEWLLHLDRLLHVSWGPALDGWVAGHDLVAGGLVAYYAVMHFGATSAALLVLWLRSPGYRRQRNVLALLNVVAFAVFWAYPAAPPRLLPHGSVDVMAMHLPVATAVEVSNANLYASMPSLHQAWALWVLAALWRVARRRWVRVLLVAHPVVTAVTVVATANHYTVDIAGAVGVTAGAYGAAAAPDRLSAAATRRLRGYRPWLAALRPFPGQRWPAVPASCPRWAGPEAGPAARCSGRTLVVGCRRAPRPRRLPSRGPRRPPSGAGRHAATPG